MAVAYETQSLRKLKQVAILSSCIGAAKTTQCQNMLHRRSRNHVANVAKWSLFHVLQARRRGQGWSRMAARLSVPAIWPI